MSEVRTQTDERAALIAAAELVGRLLLHEVDERALAGLRGLGPDAAGLGEHLPSPEDQAAWIEEQAAEYHERFLGPRGTPLVQSLWTDGRFEGEAAGRVAQLAKAAGFEHDAAAARGAVRDHLGCLLLLWARAEQDSWSRPVADELAREHLDWARAPLSKAVRDGGFYGAVADLCGALLARLQGRVD